MQELLAFLEILESKDHKVSKESLVDRVMMERKEIQVRRAIQGHEVNLELRERRGKRY